MTHSYDGEIFCVETDLNVSAIRRFPENHAAWDHEYYWSDPFGNVSSQTNRPVTPLQGRKNEIRTPLARPPAPCQLAYR